MARQKKATSSGLAVVYCRVSTAGQADEGVSLAAQEAACRRWADAQGLEVLDVCVDAGVSGAADVADCPGLMAAMTALQAKPGSVLVATKRCRLGRDVVRVATIERLVASTGGRLATVEGVTGDGPEAALLRMITDAFAQFERALIASRTKAALAHKRSRGERVGTLPRGYRADEHGRLVPDETEQKVLRLVRELRAQGLTLRAIADELGRQGYVSRRGRPYDFTGVGLMLRAA